MFPCVITTLATLATLASAQIFYGLSQLMSNNKNFTMIHWVFFNHAPLRDRFRSLRSLRLLARRFSMVCYDRINGILTGYSFLCFWVITKKHRHSMNSRAIFHLSNYFQSHKWLQEQADSSQSRTYRHMESAKKNALNCT